MVFKEIILEKLTILADEKKSKNEIFRYRAYKNAIQSIKDYDNDINDIKDLDKISGLSKTGSIRKKIIELINTGNISQIQNIGNEITAIIIIISLMFHQIIIYSKIKIRINCIQESYWKYS